MSAEISLYETEFMVDGDRIVVDTKDCYLNGESYIETQVFLYDEDDNCDMVDVICHNLNDDMEQLKIVHQQVVNRWKHQ